MAVYFLTTHSLPPPLSRRWQANESSDPYLYGDQNVLSVTSDRASKVV